MSGADTWCRPPEGTPLRSVCWLYVDLAGGRRDWCAAMWLDGDMWCGPVVVGANRAARAGWRFHSLATPPQKEP